MFRKNELFARVANLEILCTRLEDDLDTLEMKVKELESKNKKVVKKTTKKVK